MFWLLILIHNVPPLSDLFYGLTKDLPPLLAAHNRHRPVFIWPCQGRPKGARRAEGPLPGQIRRYNEKSAEAVLIWELLFILFQRKSSIVTGPPTFVNSIDYYIKNRLLQNFSLFAFRNQNSKFQKGVEIKNTKAWILFDVNDIHFVDIRFGNG